MTPARSSQAEDKTEVTNFSTRERPNKVFLFFPLASWAKYLHCYVKKQLNVAGDNPTLTKKYLHVEIRADKTDRAISAVSRRARTCLFLMLQQY